MQTTPTRFQALDVFRGMTICLMIIVNTPGNWETTFSPLKHAAWHGFTPTDLVFPSFLFAVGNAISFVMPKWESLPSHDVLLKILKRTGMIFLLGYLMYWFPFFRHTASGALEFSPFSDTRVFGVLQRIALCYGVAALMIYYLREKAAVMLSVVFLFLYWILCYLLGDSRDPLSLDGNAVLHVDRMLLSDNHLYHGEGVAFDPEGLLSTLPAIANVVGGYVAGRYIKQKGFTYEMLSKLFLYGSLLLLGAYAWDLIFPINKKLWTSSYVLLTVGLDCIILALVIYAIHFKSVKSGTYFFEVFGKNPLTVYLFSELAATLMYFFAVNPGQSVYQFVYQRIFSHFGGYMGSLFFAVSFMLLCWLVGYIMDKKKIYIRV